MNKSAMRRTLFRWGKRLLYTGAVLLLLLLVLEGLYRTQALDFYAPELRQFNQEGALAPSDKPVLLIGGDSYTAGNYTYAYHLKAQLPNTRVINAGVSGTGIVQAQLIAEKRFNQFQPAAFIYQVYPGNDLFDIRYPVNYESTSWLKNTYWVVAQRLRSLAFLNYRMAQVWASATHTQTELEALAPDKTLPFAPQHYAASEKAYFQASPYLVEDQILLTNGRQQDMEHLLEGLDQIAAMCQKANIPFYLLLIPHPAQINATYRDRLKQVGARFAEEHRFNEPFPFHQAINEHFENSENVFILDATSFIREQEEQTPMYFTNDAHLNYEGQELLAGWVKRNLTSGQEVNINP